MEMLNEFMIVILSYFMMFFTDVVPLEEKMTQFEVGYWFVYILAIILFSNIGYMSFNMYKRSQSAAKRALT